jgi:hypothetical protein
MKKIVGYGLLMLVSIAGAWFLLQQGFSRIQELRQLERVPASQAAYVLSGEVTLNGQAVPQQNTTGSYFTQTPSLYYRYIREKKSKDSDGNTRWQTEFSHSDGLDFLLQDESGQVLLRTGTNREVIDWSLQERFSEIQGDIRHREWRLEPGDKVFVFGKAVIENGQVQIRFDQSGFYTPLISHFSQADSQAAMGGQGLWWLWGGLSCVALAIFALIHLLGVHRILVFVALLGLALILVLTQMSLLMMRRDLQNGLAHYQNQKKSAEELAQSVFSNAQLLWQDWQNLNALPPAEMVRLQAYKFHLALSQQHLVRQMSVLPERWLMPLWKLPAPVSVPLNAEEQIQIQQQAQQVSIGKLKGLWPWMTIGAGLLLAILMTWLALRLIRTKRIIENLQMTPTGGVSCGLAEVQGEIVPAENTQLLRTPYFGLDCVWYSYRKEERRNSGKNSKWVTLENDVVGQKFFVRDAEGQIPVEPHQAEIITRHKHQKTEGRLRYTETVLQPGDTLYVVASAALDAEQPDRLVLRKGEMADLFILSNYSEREVMLMKARNSMLTLCAAFSGLLLACLLGFGLRGSFTPLDFLAAAALMPIYMLLLMLVLHYNDIIFLQRRAMRNWANIEVALKKRKELIDGIARTAKAFLEHEKNLQQKLAQLRAALTQTQNNRDKVAEYVRLEQNFHRNLSATIENYPDLKGQQLMQNLMNVITRGETEIALLRQGYNDAVTAYNTRIASVPDVFFAKIFHFRRMGLIAA